MLPTTQRAAVVAAVEIASYDEIKTRLTPSLGDGLLNHFVSGTSAGFLATCASNPFDVMKSRLMSQPVDSNGCGTLYTGTLDCFCKTVKAEGVTSLWKGFVPSFSRIGPHCVVAFVALEQMRALARKFES